MSESKIQALTPDDMLTLDAVDFTSLVWLANDCIRETLKGYPVVVPYSGPLPPHEMTCKLAGYFNQRWNVSFAESDRGNNWHMVLQAK